MEDRIHIHASIRHANVELPLKGLVAEAKFNWSQYSRQDEHYSQNLPRYSFRESFETPKEGLGVLDQATTYRYSYESTSYTADLMLRYNNTFGNTMWQVCSVMSSIVVKLQDSVQQRKV